MKMPTKTKIYGWSAFNVFRSFLDVDGVLPAVCVCIISTSINFLFSLYLFVIVVMLCFYILCLLEVPDDLEYLLADHPDSR